MLSTFFKIGKCGNGGLIFVNRFILILILNGYGTLTKSMMRKFLAIILYLYSCSGFGNIFTDEFENQIMNEVGGNTPTTVKDFMVNLI